MNWDAIGAIGEIAGAAAVVLSLVYLAVQVRQNTQILRRSSTADAVSAWREWNGRLIDSADVTRIFRKGVEGLQHLDPDDRARFVALIGTFFKTFEDLHYQYLHGFMDPEVWRGWQVFGAIYLTSPGCRQYWDERRSAFSTDFQKWVDNLAADPSLKRMDQLAAEDSLTPDSIPPEPRPTDDSRVAEESGGAGVGGIVST